MFSNGSVHICLLQGQSQGNSTCNDAQRKKVVDEISYNCSNYNSSNNVNNYTIARCDSSERLTDSSGFAIVDERLWTLFIIIGVLGVVGNASVALVLLRFTNMRRRLTNIYVINQSVIDFVASLFLLLTTIFQDQTVSSGLAGELKCRIWITKLPFWAAMMNSSTNLVAITLERYMKIVKPIVHRSSFTRPRAIASLFFVWLIGPVYQCLTNAPTTGIINGQCALMAMWPSDAAKTTENMVHFMLQYFLPIVIFVYCYSKMALALRRRKFHKISVAPKPVSANVSSKESAPKKGAHSIVKTMIIVCVAFFVCMSVNQWLFLLIDFGLFDTATVFTSQIYWISVITMYLNCCINPAIYAATYQQFQQAVRRLLCSAKEEKALNAVTAAAAATTTTMMTSQTGATEPTAHFTSSHQPPCSSDPAKRVQRLTVAAVDIAM